MIFSFTERAGKKRKPEVRTAREDQAMKSVSGAHCVDDDVREGTRIEALQLDVVAEGGEVAIQSA